jgi:hypothetical protein
VTLTRQTLFEAQVPCESSLVKADSLNEAADQISSTRHASDDEMKKEVGFLRSWTFNYKGRRRRVEHAIDSSYCSGADSSYEGDDDNMALIKPRFMKNRSDDQ